MILNVQDIQNELIYYLKSGGKERFYLGFESLDKLYGIREASRTDWTGYPGSGKTELLIESLWNCSKYYDHKHLIFMPDAGSTIEVIAKLFHKITNKRLEKYYWNEYGRQETDYLAEEKDVYRYLPEILEYFKVFNPKKTAVTPKIFWDFAVENKEELGIFSAVVDSWNNLYHDSEGMRDDKWLANTLQYGNTLVEQSGLHFHTIIHPKTARVKDGKVITPTYHEMKGGSEWGNYAKSIIIVHRDRENNLTEVIIDKAKGSNIGVRGNLQLGFDVSRGKYFEYDFKNGGSNKYAEKRIEQKTINSFETKDDLPF